jgi:septum formation protein|tara:strand:- start:2643 stop:3254 length:612 start_codon:yes stop_codon:yes gene_type:complete
MDLLMDEELILASSSHVRKELLLKANISFISVKPNIDEAEVKSSLLMEGYSPRNIADALAELKASKISLKHPNSLVLGCDQVLEFEGSLLEKPASKNSAVEQLLKLSGERHVAFSAAVIFENCQPIWRFVGKTELFFKKNSAKYINDYVNRNWDSIKNSVGGYKIEEEGCRLCTKINGDYFSILGIPLLEIINFLGVKGVIDA